MECRKHLLHFCICHKSHNCTNIHSHKMHKNRPDNSQVLKNAELYENSHQKATATLLLTVHKIWCNRYIIGEQFNFITQINSGDPYFCSLCCVCSFSTFDANLSKMKCFQFQIEFSRDAREFQPTLAILLVNYVFLGI